MTTVIYHRADFDGIFCREIAKKFLPDANLIGWDYGDPHLEFPKEGSVYVLDLSPDCFWEYPLRIENVRRLIWIDHHKSAIEKYPSSAIAGYRIDGVAACRLTWQWFTMVDGNTSYGNVGNSIRAAGVLPMIHHYKNREVNEPFAVRLAGEYDIWDRRDSRAELFQHGLRSCDLDAHWTEILSLNQRGTVSQVEALMDVGHKKNLIEPDGTMIPAIVWTLLANGKVVQYAKQKENESIIKAQSYTVQFEGLTFLCCNHARFNSLLFTAALTPEHDGCLGWCYDGKGFKVSLYHAPGKEHHDLSLIATKHGGGGHRGACGFRCDKLPWL